MENLRWRGIWDYQQTYEVGDVVYFQIDGFTYVCISTPSRSFPSYPNSGIKLMAGFTPQITDLDGGLF